jgi:hypothetical protein
MTAPGRRPGCGYPPTARFRALAAFSRVDRRRAAALRRGASSSERSLPSGSISAARRSQIADRAASAWWARAIGRAHREFAAIWARNRSVPASYSPLRAAAAVWTHSRCGLCGRLNRCRSKGPRQTLNSPPATSRHPGVQLGPGIAARHPQTERDRRIGGVDPQIRGQSRPRGSGGRGIAALESEDGTGSPTAAPPGTMMSSTQVRSLFPWDGGAVSRST